MILKKVNSMGAFAKVNEDFKDGDVLQVLDAGKETEGEYGPQVIFQVRLPNTESKNLAFNLTSRNYLIDAYGEDTTEWKGKTVKTWVVKQMVSGKMRNIVYLTSPEQILEGMD